MSKLFLNQGTKSKRIMPSGRKKQEKMLNEDLVYCNLNSRF
jgi:hypothetical protein